jgi:hypothetical protein
MFFYACLAGLYLLLDYAAGTSLNRTFALVFGLVGALPGLYALAQLRSRTMLAVLLLYVALFAAAPYMNLSPRKPFLRDIMRVQAGMPLAEVDTIMARYQRRPASAGALDEAGIVGYQNRFGAGDVDSLVIRFEQGRAVEVKPLLD